MPIGGPFWTPIDTGLPQKLAEAIQAGSETLDLGVGEGILITPGLALDVGFVSGFNGKAANMPGAIVDPAKLKAATEACLALKAVNKVCYVVGYMQGGSAYLASR